MGKLLFIAIIFLLIYWIIRSIRSTKQEDEPPLDAIENMVCCAHCGVHLPESESIKDQDNSFCCDDHLQKFLHSET